MATWKRLPVMFLAIALLLAGVLLGLGWQLVRQDREVAAQRLQQRRENAADLAVAARWKPGRRSGCLYPVAPAAPGPPASLFAEADRLEFGQADYQMAIAVLSELARANVRGGRSDGGGVARGSGGPSGAPQRPRTPAAGPSGAARSPRAARRLEAAALAMPLGAAQRDTRAEAQLQAAINKETVEGDLKAAIELYRKLAQSANRAAAAKALARMGQCFEKLGDAEARKAYERAIRDFGDQKEAVATARAQAILTSVLRTAQQQDKDVFQLLTDLLRSPQPKLLDIIPGGASQPTAGAPAPAGSVPVEIRFPACSDIPLLPGYLPSPGNRSFFSSA
ncbi:MAG: hypothetical protein AAB225_01545 [Acidobacteriota bacterium]